MYKSNINQYMYVCIYIYLYIHIYLNKGANSAGTSDHPRRNRLQWFRMETVRCASSGLLGAHCSLALARVTLQTLGLWARPCFSEKSGKKTPWLMVPYGPWNDDKWSRIHIYKIVMVPWVVRNGPNICLNVDTDPPIYPPGWSITVDIDGRKGFTYMKIRSILTVDKDSPTENTVDRRWWIKIRINLVVDFIDDTCEKLKCIDRNFTKSGTRTCLVQMIKWKQEFRNLISEGQDSDFWND